jgi:hypothetical protein
VVVLYALLVLPLALAWRDPRFARSGLRCACSQPRWSPSRRPRWCPRAIYGAKLALGNGPRRHPRRSYFEAAQRIRAADPGLRAVEARKSADLYLGIQPFNGCA